MELTKLLLTLNISIVLTIIIPGISSANDNERIVKSFFANGDTRLTCRMACAGGWGSSRKSAKEMYDQQQWNELLQLVVRIGYDTDLGYFYLGRTAEALGYKAAAKTYYEFAISNPYKCIGVLFNNCDGFQLPADAQVRLNQVNAELSTQAPPSNLSQSNSLEIPVKAPQQAVSVKANEVDKSSKPNTDPAVIETKVATEAIHINEAPFGLTWGISELKVKSLKVKFEKNSKSGHISIFRTSSLPKNISFAKSYILYFHPNQGLQKIVVISKSINNDLDGKRGKNLYETTKSQITTKYSSKPKSVEFSGINPNKGSEDFYQCLKSPECGIWNSIWKNPNVIGLELQGLNRGIGYLKLTYEGPKWGQVIDDNKSPLTLEDTSAL